jgi:Uri superfamily endonuclease
MSTTNSSALDRHFKGQKPTKAHLDYLDKILSSINKTHMPKVMEMRNTIELLLLNNPKSENEVVSYLS